MFQPEVYCKRLRIRFRLCNLKIRSNIAMVKVIMYHYNITCKNQAVKTYEIDDLPIESDNICLLAPSWKLNAAERENWFFELLITCSLSDISNVTGSLVVLDILGSESTFISALLSSLVSVES